MRQTKQKCLLTTRPAKGNCFLGYEAKDEKVLQRVSRLEKEISEAKNKLSIVMEETKRLRGTNTEMKNRTKSHVEKKT